MLEFRNVSKTYKQNQTVLNNLNLQVKQGEFLVLVGPSGSGKTTTLKMINRLIEPTTGDIYLNQKKLTDYNLKELRLSIGYVLQQIALFPNLTVAENIELIPELKKWPRLKRQTRAKELLALVGLEPSQYASRKPAELSGGEQQRVGILRAIAAEPDLILMDEPFSALDPIARHQLQEMIKEIHQRIKSTIVFVTHDMKEALTLGERICMMNKGEIIQVDTPAAIQAAPKNEFVAEFFKHEQENQRAGVKDFIVNDLKEFFSPAPKNHQSNLVTIPIETTLVQLLALFEEVTEVAVTDQAQIIGILSQQAVFQFMRTYLTEGGEGND